MTAAELTRKPSQVSTRGVDYVGFANFPNQVFRRCIKDGFEFTLMVVGQSGLGKSTFINSLFLAELNDRSTPPEVPRTVEIKSKTVCLLENDVRLKTTFVDTPGFGDAVNNADCWKPIIDFVDQKYAEYLTEETKIERPAKIEDTRVHLCLYFIAPTGHGLKELDIAFMKALQDRVNIVPVIAKADTLTPSELTRFKQNILRDLQASDIRLYEFPPLEPTVDGSAPPKAAEYLNRIPFAVIGSNEVKEVGKYKVRIREYPWGTVEVENLSHNDFVPLRDMIIRNNLIDLIDVTRNVHYENFRYRQMSKMPKGALDRDPFTQLEQELRDRERDTEDARQAKEAIFADKVAQREKKLRERADVLEIEEKENEQVLNEKRALLEQLLTETADYRRPTGASDSSSSIGRGSPTEKPKKKGTLGLFRSNN